MGTCGGQIRVFVCDLLGVWWSSFVWWLGEIVGDGVGSDAGAAQCSDCVGVRVFSGEGAGTAHIDATGVVVVDINAFDGDSLRAMPAQNSSP